MTTYEAHYCPTCGTDLHRREFDGRERGYCEDCGEYIFRSAVPGASVTVVDDDRVLLIERGVEPHRGAWAVPGGHLEYDEPPAVGAARELEEETGVAVDPAALTMLGTEFSVTADKGYLAVDYAVAREHTDGEPVAGTDATDARFWHPADLKSGDVPTREVDWRRIERAFATVG